MSWQKAIHLSYHPAYQALIFGALKNLHQSPLQENWDDLVQEARLALASKLMLSDKGQINHSYLYQCIYWRILDLLRSQQRRQSRQTSASADQELTFIDYQMARVYARHGNDRLFNQLKPMLTRQQQAYLDLLLSGYGDTEIALQWHCSRQAVNKLRQRIIKKGRQFFQTDAAKQWHPDHALQPSFSLGFR